MKLNRLLHIGHNSKNKENVFSYCGLMLYVTNVSDKSQDEFEFGISNHLLPAFECDFNNTLHVYPRTWLNKFNYL